MMKRPGAGVGSEPRRIGSDTALHESASYQCNAISYCIDVVTCLLAMPL